MSVYPPPRHWRAGAHGNIIAGRKPRSGVRSGPRRRCDESCKKFLNKLEARQALRYCTDDRESYQKLLPTKHRISKDQTQDIERQNLNFRTHIKRMQRETICF
jgi:hypothetical protein